MLAEDLKTGTDVRLLQLGDIGVGQFLDKSDKWISHERFRDLGCTEVRPGDLLISRMAEPIVRACLVPDLGVPLITAVDVTICRVRAREVDPRFVMCALNSPAVRAQAEAIASGTTRKRITRKRLARLLLPLPPIEEQRRIVDTVENMIRWLRSGEASLSLLRKRLEHLRLSLFQTVLTTGVERTAGELLDGIEAGKSFKCHGRQADLDEWGIIKVSAITTGTFNETENKAILREADVDPRWEIKKGDLLISRANTSKYVGATVLVGETRARLLLSDKSLRLKVRADVDPAWLQLALSAPTSRTQMSDIATGTSDSMRNLSQDKIRLLVLRVPPLERQEELVEMVRRRLVVIDAAEEEIRRSAERARTLQEAILNRMTRRTSVPAPREDIVITADAGA